MACLDKDDYYYLFCNFDSNQNGTIDFCELERVLQYFGFNPTETDLQDCMGYMDKNRDDVIDFDEFYEFVTTLKDPVGEIRQAFAAFDTNGDGHIDEKELKKMFTSGCFSPEDIDGLFQLVDINEDGKIDYEEFVELFTQTYYDQDVQSRK